ncbi:hypothetical protein [Croceivirga radicis]|uniref:hypothetical protein n=1 Tax=Croceivirga radicis TaxID=1929488 RepID=UPI000255ABE6|nr:hypothetical protein [Croceivirga radicis]
MNERGKINTKLITEGLIALLITFSPIFFYLYKYVPDSDKLDLGLFVITANGFINVGDYFYYLFGKIVPLILLIIWFVTSKNWWYHVILIPIAMYSFQLFTVINYDSNIKLDEKEILYIAGVTMFITPVVYFIRLKLVDKYVHGIDLEAMDQELKILKEKEALKKEWEKLEQQKAALLKKM